MTERPDTRLRDWLDETIGQIPEAAKGTQQVMSQIEKTPQVGRWLPFPLLQRKAKASTPTTDHTAHFQPSPIPATNGHSPNAPGRTQSMLSPVKAITAGALVFTIGGMLLIAQPFDQQASAPQAEAETEAPTWVTGKVAYASSCTSPSQEVDGDVRHAWGYQCSPQRWTSSDQRLSGAVSYRWNEDVYKVDESFISVNTAAAYLRNDDGGWACSSSNLLEGSGLYPHWVTGETLTCVGEGGHEGLSALVVIDQGDPSHPLVGLIFSGGFPPVPEPPAAD